MATLIVNADTYKKMSAYVESDIIDRAYNVAHSRPEIEQLKQIAKEVGLSDLCEQIETIRINKQKEMETQRYLDKLSFSGFMLIVCIVLAIIINI